MAITHHNVTLPVCTSEVNVELYRIRREVVPGVTTRESERCSTICRFHL